MSPKGNAMNTASDIDAMSSALSFIPKGGSGATAIRSGRNNQNPQTQRGVSTPSNAYFDTYQKMNWLMSTLQNTHEKKTSKPSLKTIQTGATGIPNVRVIKDNFNDSIYAGGQNLKDKTSLPATNRDSMVDDDKRVNFSLESPTLASKSSPKKADGKNIITKHGINVPRNFKQLAKQSFDNQLQRKATMTSAIDSFYDQNKLYIKSTQQEATLRSRRVSG